MINVNLLPKNLRRVREPGYWKLLAVAFPVVVLGVAATLQFLAARTEANLQQDRANRQAQVELLQPFIDERQALLDRQRQLNELIAVRRAVRENRIAWTGEIVELIETLPPQGNAARPVVDFSSITMRSLQGAQTNPQRFEGAPVIAEFAVSGTAIALDALADFVATLEQSPDFGVQFQSASSNDEEGNFSYNLTVGAIAESEGGANP